MATDLQALVIIEKDVNRDLISWTFPKLDSAFDKVLKARCGLSETDGYGPTFRFSRFGQSWHYMTWVGISVQNSKVTAASVTIVAKDFAPSKYKALLEIMSKQYAAKISPLPAMSGYLSIVTKKMLKSKEGNFKESDFDKRRDLISNVKKVFEMFQAESILIWMAMILKKRIFVYADKLSELLLVIRSFPLMGCWHRQNWNLLRPYMTLAPAELEELERLGVYVCGFTDPSCVGQTKLYDIYFNLSERSYQINDESKNDFVLGRFHKQTVEGFLKAAEDGNNQTLIKAIANKTKSLLDKIKSLKTDHDDGSYITLEELSTNKLPPNMAQFLFNVAQAEGMCKK